MILKIKKYFYANAGTGPWFEGSSGKHQLNCLMWAGHCTPIYTNFGAIELVAGMCWMFHNVFLCLYTIFLSLSQCFCLYIAVYKSCLYI